MEMEGRKECDLAQHLQSQFSIQMAIYIHESPYHTGLIIVLKIIFWKNHIEIFLRKDSEN